MRIDILCSGSKGNCTLIRTKRTAIMLDCGAASKKYITNSLKQVGMDPDDIQAMLITHNHSDHIKQLRHFSNMPVYAYCGLNIRDPKKNPVKLLYHHIQPLHSFYLGDLFITPIPLSHDAGPTVGFVIVGPQKEKLVYITDTGYVHSDLIPLLADADYYIMESNHDVQMLMDSDRSMWLKQRILSDTGHLSNQYSAGLLCQLITPHTRNVVLAHLSEETNTPRLALDTFEDAFARSGISQRNFKLETAWQDRITTLGSIQEEKRRPTPVIETKKVLTRPNIKPKPAAAPLTLWNTTSEDDAFMQEEEILLNEDLMN